MEDQFNLNSAVREVRVAGIENDQRPFRLVYQLAIRMPIKDWHGEVSECECARRDGGFDRFLPYR